MNLLRWKNETVYYIEIPTILGSYSFLFKKIPYGEFKRIRHAINYMSIDEVSLQDQIIREYLLEPNYELDQIEELPAGIPEVLSNLIILLSDPKISPDNEGKLDLDLFNNKLQIGRIMSRSSLELQIMTTICAVFKGYTFESLEKLTFDKINQLFACAEKHLLDIGALDKPLEVGLISNEAPEETDNSSSEKDEDIDFLLNMAKKAQEEKIKIDNQKIYEKEKVQEYKQQVTTESKASTVSSSNGASVNSNSGSSNSSIKQAADPETNLDFLVKPAKISESNPNHKKLQELENKRVEAINRSRIESNKNLRSGYVPPKDASVDANRVRMAVPGIDYSNSGLEIDGNLPVLTDEEVAELEMKMGLLQAGHELLTKVEQSNRKAKEDKIKEALKGSSKKYLSLKEIKKIKDSI